MKILTSNHQILRKIFFAVGTLTIVLSSLLNVWSAAATTTIQVPWAISYQGGTDAGGSVDNKGANYKFILQDQAKPANPMGNLKIIVHENVPTITTSYTNASGAALGKPNTEHPKDSHYAFQGTNEKDGSFVDDVHLKEDSTVPEMNGYASAANNGGICKITYAPFEHDYTTVDITDPQSLGWPLHPNPTVQTQSLVVTDKYTPGLFGQNPTYTFTCTDIKPDKS